MENLEFEGVHQTIRSFEGVVKTTGGDSRYTIVSSTGNPVKYMWLHEHDCEVVKYKILTCNKFENAVTFDSLELALSLVNTINEVAQTTYTVVEFED